MIDRETKNSLLKWIPVSLRIIKARFCCKLAKMTIPQCHTPTDQADRGGKEECYQILQDQIFNVKSRDILIIAGDKHAKNAEGFESFIGH